MSDTDTGLQVYDRRDREPLEWEGSPVAKCSGCGMVRELRKGFCRQCAREGVIGPATRAVTYQEATLW